LEFEDFDVQEAETIFRNPSVDNIKTKQVKERERIQPQPSDTYFCEAEF
jgi:hypothetical protein